MCKYKIKEHACDERKDLNFKVRMVASTKNPFRQPLEIANSLQKHIFWTIFAKTGRLQQVYCVRQGLAEPVRKSQRSENFFEILLQLYGLAWNPYKYGVFEQYNNLLQLGYIWRSSVARCST